MQIEPRIEHSGCLGLILDGSTTINSDRVLANLSYLQAWELQDQED